MLHVYGLVIFLKSLIFLKKNKELYTFLTFFRMLHDVTRLWSRDFFKKLNFS